MRDEERPFQIGTRGHERGLRGDAPSLGGGEMGQLGGHGHPPGGKGVHEVFPHRERRIGVGNGPGHDALGDEGAEALPVRVLFGSEPRDHALEPLKSRDETLGRWVFHEERLETEGIE